MKRSWFSLAAVLSLIVAVSIASAQQDYSGSQPSGTSSSTTSSSSSSQMQSQSTDPSTTSPTTEASTTSDPATSSTLPATASPMPLVGVIGLLTLAAGLWIARMRQRKA